MIAVESFIRSRGVSHGAGLAIPGAVPAKSRACQSCVCRARAARISCRFERERRPLLVILRMTGWEDAAHDILVWTRLMSPRRLQCHEAHDTLQLGRGACCFPVLEKLRHAVVQIHVEGRSHFLKHRLLRFALDDAGVRKGFLFETHPLLERRLQFHQ